MTNAHLAADIGGTFTDIAVTHQGDLLTCKVPTVSAAPEEGIFRGIQQAMSETGLTAADFNLIVHGRTLATNALIERKGARTAMVVTDGFRKRHGIHSTFLKHQAGPVTVHRGLSI